MNRTRDSDVLGSQPKVGHGNMLTPSGAQKLSTMDALTYLKAVKENFQDRKDKYDEFLEVMKDFKAQRVSTSGVISRVKELFKENKDLILGFNSFLPKGYEITLPPSDDLFQKQNAAKFDKALNFVNKIKARFEGNDKVYMAFIDTLMSMRRIGKPMEDVFHEVSLLLDGHNDLIIEFTHFLPNVYAAASIHYPEPPRNVLLEDDISHPKAMATPNEVEKAAAISFMSGQYENYNDKEQLNTAEKLQSNKEEIGKTELPRSDQSHQVQDPEAAFCKKVNEGLQDPENYGKILDCIRSYKSKFYPASQFRNLVASLLGKHPDLMAACEDFITHIEKTVSRHSRLYRSQKVNGDGDDYDKVDKYENGDQVNKDRDRHDKDVHGQKNSPYGGREKLIAKSIQDLDLSNCESCTPSYRRLPDNYQVPSASRRTEVGDDVLNDHWVSVTSGSEDYSFKNMRKNQYEESLFRCEDDRFELDMLLESVNATSKCVEQLVERMNDSNKTSDSSFFIEEHLTALNLRCIERLYGDHGLDVIDVLRKNAHLSLPVILTRLKQKQEEWARCRADFNNVWYEIYARNYHKSLDHRSFYFKQQDTKNLSAKALLTEIKEMSEKNQQKDEMVLFTRAGVMQPNIPQLEFEYSDPDIQEDLYQLIKFSYRKVCTPEQRDKVMIIWRLFIEPLLGLRVRPPSRGDKGADTRKSCTPQPVENDDHVNEANGVINRHESSSTMHIVSGGPSHGSDTIPGESKIVYHPHQKDDSNMMTTKSIHGETTGTLEGGVASIPIEKSALGNDASASALPSDIKVQKCQQQTEPGSKGERECGESSPDNNIEISDFPEVGNIYDKLEQTPLENAPTCGETVGEEANAIADEEVEESAQGSSGSENALGNAEISASESANGEECSPDDPDDEAEHDGNDSKAETEAEADSVIDVHETEGSMLPCQFLRTVKPIVLDAPRVLGCTEKKTSIFYGNDSFYLLFRLHQMLYERMVIAKLHSSSPVNKWKVLSDAYLADPYARFKESLHSFLNGSSDSVKFEENCRSIIGAQSYVLFTLDKLIHKLIKQIQKIAAEEMDMKLLHLYNYEMSRNSKTFVDAVYHENARFLIPDDNLYRIEYFPFTKRMTMQLMTNDHGKLEPSAVSMDPSFASYLNNELLSVAPNGDEKTGMYMKRLKRKLYPGDDNSATLKAMEDLIIMNNLEMKINCIERKVSYAPDTADVVCRITKRKRDLHENCSMCINRQVKRIKLPLDMV